MPPTSSAWRPRRPMSAERLPGRRLELGDGELLVRIDQVQEMVAHGGSGLLAAAWRSRCPCPGRRTWSRPTRCRSPPFAGRAREPAPTCPRRSRRRGRLCSSARHRDAHAMPGPSRHLLQTAREMVWVAGGHLHTGQRSGLRAADGGTRREVHQLSLTRAAGQHGLVATADALDEHLLDCGRPAPGGGTGRSGPPPPSGARNVRRSRRPGRRRAPWHAALVPGRGENMKVKAES